MMTHDEIITVLQAHKEGKPLECFSVMYRWEPSEQLSLEAILHDITNNETSYRIAPNPEYVPWNTIEEVIPHMGKVIKSKDDLYYDTIYFMRITSEGLTVQGRTAKKFFENYEFIDGTPCGKLVVK